MEREKEGGEGEGGWRGRRRVEREKEGGEREGGERVERKSEGGRKRERVERKRKNGRKGRVVVHLWSYTLLYCALVIPFELEFAITSAHSTCKTKQQNKNDFCCS